MHEVSSRLVVWLREVDSTNRHARDELANLADGTLVAAEAQTAGRGRRGRTWVSPPGCNLYATFVMKRWPHRPVAATWLAALATLDCLRAAAPGLDLWIKWPNDIYCGERKLCGILCETAGAGAVLAGIGVNLNMPPELLAGIDRPATSLLAETGNATAVKNFAAALAKELSGMYSAACLAGIEPVFRRWRDENRVVGQAVQVLADDGRETTGIVADIDEGGALHLVDGQGFRRVFHSGDVSLRTFPAAGAASSVTEFGHVD